MNKTSFYVYTFYRFKKIEKKDLLKKKLDIFLSRMIVRGTILLADEGINGSISGSKKNLKTIITYIRKKLKIRTLNVKTNRTNFLPFNRMKVRLKKEIVSLGKGKININKFAGKLINPSEWDEIINDKNTRIIDVRNKFEIDIGRFKNSENPHTQSFREFPKKLSLLNIKNDKKIALYCTGGIRCEKASAYLRTIGFKDVVQLKGGIINYLEYIKKNKEKSSWSGECFVFDNRVTVNRNLDSGNYFQCFGCKRPLKQKDKSSIYYKKGVHCPYCFYERSEIQKNRSSSRQKQIKIDRVQKRNNPYIKVTV